MDHRLGCGGKLPKNNIRAFSGKKGSKGCCSVMGMKSRKIQYPIQTFQIVKFKFLNAKISVFQHKINIFSVIVRDNLKIRTFAIKFRENETMA